MRTFTLDDMRAGLLDAERAFAESGSPTDGERLARSRRWLSLDSGHEEFAATAAELAGNFGRGGAPHDWAWIAGLWHLAGDERQAKKWSARITRSRNITVDAGMRAAALYLRGRYAGARKTGADVAAVWLSEVALMRDPAPLTRIRARLAKLGMVTSDGPHSSGRGTPLTAWDWLEESYLLEARLTGGPVPTHEQMLLACGVLSDEPTPGVPPPLSPPVGLSREHLSGGWLRVTEDDSVDIHLPGAPPFALRSMFDLWGAWTGQPEDSGDWILDTVYPDWRHAASELAEWIGVNYGAEQEAILVDLAVTAGGEAGVPVPLVPERREPPPLPMIQISDLDIVKCYLTDDLYVEIRVFEDGWSARVATGPLAMGEVAIPPSCATWREAARAVAGWLEHHRGGYGVAELDEALRKVDAKEAAADGD